MYSRNVSLLVESVDPAFGTNLHFDQAITLNLVAMGVSEVFRWRCRKRATPPTLVNDFYSIQVECIFCMYFFMSNQLFSRENSKNMCFKKSDSTWNFCPKLFGNLSRKKSEKSWFWGIFCFRKVSQHFLNNIENTTNKDTRRTNGLKPMFHHLTEDMKRDLFLTKK